MTLPTSTKARRLIKAGWLHVSGWLPAATAVRVNATLDTHRETAEAIASQEPPRGRPKSPRPARPRRERP